jgi:UDP-2,3-diacylglucosamine pyrophosphatase LpxH
MLGNPNLLCNFLAQVGDYARPEGERLELIINGDFVDFLAVAPHSAWTPDEDACIRKLEGAVAQFTPVFDSFRKCIAKVDLFTLTLGNHDIESALPRVTEALLNKLSTDLHSCEFVRSNQAYRVGDLLVEHGNRYDSWNAISYPDLQRVASAASRLEPVPAINPCPGSLMVEKLVNPLRDDYPFVDLLKPETKLLPLVFSALEPSLKRDVRRSFQISNLWVKQWARTRSWLPSVSSEAEQLISAKGHSTGLPENVRDVFQDELAAISREEQISVKERWQDLKKVLRPDSMATLIRSGKPLPADRVEKLRVAVVTALKSDRTFDFDGPDGPYLEAAKRVIGSGGSGRPRVVVMGHTHTMKYVPVGSDAHYVNTGTWVDLMRVPADLSILEAKTSEFSNWLRKAVLDVDSLRFSDPAYADILLDDDGTLRQPDRRPLLRRFREGPFKD